MLMLAAWLGTAALAAAREPLEFEPARHGQGSLTMVGNVPVVVVRGTPEQMGEQLGALTAGPLADIAARQEAILSGFGLPARSPLLLSLGGVLATRIPPNHLAELKAVAKSSGVGYDFLVLGNVVYDVAKIGGCSALLVDGQHSATGQVVFRPEHGFSDVWAFWTGWAGRRLSRRRKARAGLDHLSRLLGLHLGHERRRPGRGPVGSDEAGDGSPRFDPAGTPLAFCFRRVLEECATVDEAEKLLGTIRRTSMCNMAICDTAHDGGAGDHDQVGRAAAGRAGFLCLHESFPHRRVGPRRANAGATSCYRGRSTPRGCRSTTWSRSSTR